MRSAPVLQEDGLPPTGDDIVKPDAVRPQQSEKKFTHDHPPILYLQDDLAPFVQIAGQLLVRHGRLGKATPLLILEKSGLANLPLDSTLLPEKREQVLVDLILES